MQVKLAVSLDLLRIARQCSRRDELERAWKSLISGGLLAFHVQQSETTMACSSGWSALSFHTRVIWIDTPVSFMHAPYGPNAERLAMLFNVVGVRGWKLSVWSSLFWLGIKNSSIAIFHCWWCSSQNVSFRWRSNNNYLPSQIYPDFTSQCCKNRLAWCCSRRWAISSHSKLWVTSRAVELAIFFKFASTLSCFSSTKAMSNLPLRLAHIRTIYPRCHWRFKSKLSCLSSSPTTSQCSFMLATMRDVCPSLSRGFASTSSCFKSSQMILIWPKKLAMCRGV